MRHVRVVRQAILAAAVTLSISSLAFSQAQTGSLSGTVSDQSGAPVAGAAVGAREDRTGVAEHTITSEAGIYVFPNLPPGIWTITTEKTGFKREGFARQYLCIDGIWQDHLLYARLKDDLSP